MSSPSRFFRKLRLTSYPLVSPLFLTRLIVPPSSSPASTPIGAAKWRATCFQCVGVPLAEVLNETLTPPSGEKMVSKCTTRHRTSPAVVHSTQKGELKSSSLPEMVPQSSVLKRGDADNRDDGGMSSTDASVRGEEDAWVATGV